MEVSVRLRASATLQPGKNANTLRVGGFSGHRAGLDVCEKRQISGREFINRLVYQNL